MSPSKGHKSKPKYEGYKSRPFQSLGLCSDPFLSFFFFFGVIYGKSVVVVLSLSDCSFFYKSIINEMRSAYRFFFNVGIGVEYVRSKGGVGHHHSIGVGKIMGHHFFLRTIS